MGLVALVSAVVLVALSAGILSQVPEGNPVWILFHSLPPSVTPPATLTDTATATTTATIASYDNSASINSGAIQTLTATCPDGEQMVGGGYTSDPYVAVYQSYPSGNSIWTVTAYDYGGQTPVTLVGG